jgi:hypothetical protein
MKKLGLLQVVMVILASSCGCMTGPTIFERHDKYSSFPPGSDEWWAEKATLPPGQRQRYHKGKIWPVQPRSTQEPQQFSHTFHSEHYWPLPYVCQDRQAVRNVIEQQVSLGWQEETTLYARHFDLVSQQLNRAGLLQLEYILHVVPVERRTVYIQSSHDTAADDARLESVNTQIAMTSHGVVSVPVEIRDCQQTGRPASEVATINTLYNTTIPAPRLSGGGSSGGSSSP